METIKGLEDLLKDLRDLPQGLEKEIERIIELNSKELERSAKRFATTSVDTGKLRQSIKAAKTTDLSWRVFVLAKYGPYIEFGTGGLVQVPEELVEMALQFVGRGVKKVDIRPQPFLYPAFELQKPRYIEDLRELLEQELKKI